jgi:uncharacterized protein YndB with AHSA1/START domain
MPRTEGTPLRDDELFIERVFQAPVSLVWRLWEERRHMIRWWGPEGFTVTDLDVDFRPGGKWKIGMTSEAYPKKWSYGEFLKIEKEKRIEFSFTWADGSGPTTETIVIVELIPEAGSTRQTFHQRPFASLEDRDSHVLGWQSLFNKQQAYAERQS